LHLTFLLPLVDADLFTSIADMTKLLDFETEIATEIDRYIDNEHARLDRLKNTSLAALSGETAC
ncbi:hypothetical protein PENTCL1PPCAC_21052, partial [Pristionchus entomophagus]